MKDELIIERIRFFKWKLNKIRKERKKLLIKLLTFRLTQNNIRNYINMTKEYKTINNNVNFYENILVR